MNEIQFFMELAQENATHLKILNREMGGVLAELSMIKWIVGFYVGAWVTIFVGFVIKKLLKRNGNNVSTSIETKKK